MKIATYVTSGLQAPRLGVVQNDRITPLSAVLELAPDDMIELISGWHGLKATLTTGLSAHSPDSMALETVRLLPPVSRPQKIFCIGLNYADHILETGRDKPDQQVWFAKHGNCLTGAYDPVQIPRVSDKVDYEVELVAVIGKVAKHVAREDAAQYVFGYCVGNDVTVRDWQRATPQWTLGKSFDTHAPIGPWITTADEIGDPHRLGVRCLVNDDLRQDSNTSHLIFDVWDLIAHLSKAMTLVPGDLIFTGTPGGVGWAMKPPRVLVAGDRVRCEIDELGAIENRFELEG